MPSVNGQFYLSLGLGDLDDFIAPEDLQMFYIKEQAGNQLPAFSLNYLTDGAEIGSMNETSDLSVTMGASPDDAVTTTLYITKAVIGRAGDRRQVNCQGMLATPGYQQNTRTGITDKKSGIEAMQDVASQHFNTQFDVSASQDTMNWVQHNISDAAFVNHLWMRSDLGSSSTPLVGISASENTFRVRDLSAAFGGNTDWNFLPYDSDGDTDIPYHGDYVVTDNSGFINSWLGYASQSPVLDLVSGLFNNIGGSLISGLSNSFSSNQRGPAGGVDAQRTGYQNIKTANQHDTYHDAFANNQRNLAASSNFTINLSFAKVFKNLRTLDSVYFLEDTTTGTGGSTGVSGAVNQGVQSLLGSSGVTEYCSGNYIVDTVERYFAGGRVYQHGTKVTLTRDGSGGGS